MRRGSPRATFKDRPLGPQGAGASPRLSTPPASPSSPPWRRTARGTGNPRIPCRKGRAERGHLAAARVPGPEGWPRGGFKATVGGAGRAGWAVVRKAPGGAGGRRSTWQPYGDTPCAHRRPAACSHEVLHLSSRGLPSPIRPFWRQHLKARLILFLIEEPGCGGRKRLSSPGAPVPSPTLKAPYAAPCGPSSRSVVAVSPPVTLLANSRDRPASVSLGWKWHKPQLG